MKPGEARGRFAAAERGAVLAEFIVAFPVLMLTYFSFLQMAQAFTAGLVMRHATVAVARYASVAYPTRSIPDGADRATDGAGDNPSWREAAMQALGPWKDVVRVKAADVRVEGELRDGQGDLETRVDYEYSCHVPMAKYIVCRGGRITRSVRVESPLHGATYSL
jgi:hypothetical protein